MLRVSTLPGEIGVMESSRRITNNVTSGGHLGQLRGK